MTEDHDDKAAKASSDDAGTAPEDAQQAGVRPDGAPGSAPDPGSNPKSGANSAANSGATSSPAPDHAPDHAPGRAPDPAPDRAPARRETGRQAIYAPSRKDRDPAGGAGAPEAPSDGAEDIGASLQALENATLTAFAADRDALIDDMVPAAALPADRDEFYHRDPFSGDYVDYVNAREGSRTDGGAKVARKLREDLLSKPHLLPKPEEGANRGAAAVWRSLRDQLHQESLGMIDSSDREELLILKGDLMTRKALVDSVGEGLTNLIKRLDQRLAAFDKTPPKVDDGVATSAPDAASLKGKI